MKINPNKHLPIPRLFTLLQASLLLAAGTLASRAADGVWIGDADGSWASAANWVGGIIADGPNSTAYFTNDVTAQRTITLDGNRTIGHLMFGDANTASPGGWFLTNSILTLSNTAATPVITVGTMNGGDATNETRIVSVLAGGQGYFKNGVGTLTVTAVNTVSNSFGPYAVQINGGAIAATGLSSVAPRGLPIAFDNGALIYYGPNNFPNTNIVLSAGTLIKTNSPNGDINSPLFGDAAKVWNIVLPNNNLMPNGFTTAGTSNQFMGFAGNINLVGGWKLDPTNYYIWRANPGGGAHLYYGSSNAVLNLGSADDIRFRVRGTLTTAAQRMIWGGVNGGPLTHLQGSYQSDNTLITYQIGDANVPCVFAGTIENGSGGGGSTVRRTALTKTGTSTFTLQGTNTYLGDTTIAGGSLILSATASISNSPTITLTSAGAVFDVSAFAPSWTNAPGQSLGGNGTVAGSVTLESGNLIPGAGVGTLTFANNLSLSGTVSNMFEVGIGTGNNDKVVVNGDLSLDGALDTRIVPSQGVILNGTYTLFKWSGNLIGGTANLALDIPALPGTFALGLNAAAKEIYLQVTNVTIQDVTWRGDAGANWDIGVTANWRTTNGTAVTFANFNNAIFDNSGAFAAPVNLVEAVNPLSVLINSSNNYVISGPGKISGVTGLSKSGTGKLTLTTDNDFAGATTVNAGTLQVGNGSFSGSLGASMVTINTNGTLAFERDDTVTYAAALVGAGTLVQNGTNGTLILTANSVNDGRILVSAGTLQIGSGASAQGSVTATITNNAMLHYYYDAGDVAINNALAGNGTNLYEFASGSHTFTIGPTVSSPGFSGTMNLGVGVRLHAENANSGFLLGNGGQVSVPSLSQAWIDSSATNYSQSFTIAGNGWSGDTVPTAAPGLGALRLFNCTLTGPITMLGDSRIGGSSSGARIEGRISGPGYQLEIYNSGPNVDAFVLTLAPASGANDWGSTLVTRGVLQAGNASGISTNALTLTGEGRLRLNGNNISLANIYGGSPVNGTNCLVQNMDTTNAATLTVGADDSSSFFEGIFGDGASQPLGLTKVGAGTLTLTAVSTNTGPVTVAGGTIALSEPGSFGSSTLINVGAGAFFDVTGRGDQTLTLNNGQTLKGGGTVSGNVTAVSGSTVNPGSPVGALNVSGNLSLGGKLLMELNRTNTPSNCDRLNVSGSTTYGGALSVTNIGPALQANDTFQLFSAGVSGFGGGVTIATTDANNKVYTWQNNLATLGSIKVLTVTNGVNTTPTNIVTSVSGNILDLSWPADHTGWTLQTNSVDVAKTNFWFPYPGSAATNHVVLTLDPSKTNVFFRMIYP